MNAPATLSPLFQWVRTGSGFEHMRLPFNTMLARLDPAAMGLPKAPSVLVPQLMGGCLRPTLGLYLRGRRYLWLLYQPVRP